ncbi:MAG: DUF3592 domain-containing protein [bacterium]
MHKSTSPKSLGSWMLVLFGLPFMAVGIIVGVMSWNMWSLWHKSATWSRVPAIVSQVELQTHHGDNGGVSYSVNCRYSYSVAGRKYTSDRVGVEKHGSSDGYHRMRYDVLVRHRDSKTPVEVLVDPAQPDQAIAFREKSTTMLVLPLCAVVFGVPGLVVFCLGLAAFFKGGRMSRLLAMNPGRPWRADSRWRVFELHDHPVQRIAGRLAGGLFTAVFVSVFWITMGSDKHAPLFAKVIIGLFSLIPAGMFVSAAYNISRFLKYGNPRLVLRQLPFVPGRENSALLYVKTHIASDKGVELKLRCMKKETVKRGNGTSIEEREVYSEVKIEAEDLAGRTGRGSVVPVRFTIPVEQPETLSGNMPDFTWRISVRAATPGVDFFAEFDVPVYRVDDPELMDINPMAK